MNIGLLKWFDDEKGFGVISAINSALELIEKHNITSTEANNEIFLHIKNWKDSKPIDSSKIIPVVFNTAFERNKIAAKQCEYFKSTKQNWTLLLSHLGNYRPSAHVAPTPRISYHQQLDAEQKHH